MAEFSYMVPFICHFAAGVFGKDGRELDLPVRDMFELAKLRGWSDDPDDPGGATMVDVTIATYSQYKGYQTTKGELRNISFEEWCEILKRMFWDRCCGDEIKSQGLAHLIVDWVWASGPGVIKRVQRLAGVEADGVVGPVTLAALNAQKPPSMSRNLQLKNEAAGGVGSSQGETLSLFDRVKQERERFYRSCPGAWKYLNGWLRRLNAIRADGSFLIYGKRLKAQG